MSRASVMILCAAPALLGTNAVAQPAADEHVRAELISETGALVPGQRAWLGLRLVHEPHWHTYWVNPGDSGLPTKLEWQLPPGLRAGAIVWPAPQRFEAGGLYNVGYDGDVLLPVPLDVDARARLGSVAHVAAEANWLVCREECIPGRDTLALELPVAATASADPRWRPAFAAARAALPRASTLGGVARLAGDRVEVTLSGADLPPSDAFEAFVVQREVVGYAPPQVSRRDGSLSLRFERSEYYTAPPPGLDLVLVDGAPAARTARAIRVPFAADLHRPAQP